MKKGLCIYGPTATGKTDLAITLAKRYNGELISADSRQIYGQLDIGTGKVNFSSHVKKHSGFWIVNGVKIYGFDLLKPGENYSAADFVKFANKQIVKIAKSNKLPIIVGGTGFYIKSLIGGIGSIGIKADKKLRKEIEKLSAEELYKRLAKLDKKRASGMNKSDSQNPRRLIRAIEIAEFNKRLGSTIPLSHYPTIPPSNYILICLIAPNEFLFKRADKWLETRLKKGLIGEIKNLISKKVNSIWLENLGLEYRWITRYLMGKITEEEAIKRLRGDIHDFIRRQKTFRSQFPQAEVFDISKNKWQKELDWFVKSHLAQ